MDSDIDPYVFILAAEIYWVDLCYGAFSLVAHNSITVATLIDSLIRDVFARAFEFY